MMTKAKEYHLATASHAYELDEVVNRLLGEGWLLYGEPVIASTSVKDAVGDEHESGTFSQALIKV
jgi:hypothetical protein